MEIKTKDRDDPLETNQVQNYPIDDYEIPNWEICSPENMKLVQGEFDKLKMAIKGIDQNVSNLLQAQENEFLSVYKDHAKNIANDFKRLQTEIQVKELAIKNHEYVKELEKERDWYKKEALHLDSMLTKTKSNENSLQEKLEQLEQDKSWLSNQLKELLKEKKELISQLVQNEQETTGKNNRNVCH
jgi:CII-binding regulator of phage lambda lysogenization HflD